MDLGRVLLPAKILLLLMFGYLVYSLNCFDN